MTAPTSGPSDLTGQTALVTGAAGGIGEKVCAVLSREGADVVASDIVDLTEAVRLVEKNDTTCEAVECDVTDPASVATLVEHAIDAFGSVEILVTAHGTVTRSDFSELSVVAWERDIEVNLKGSFLVTQPVYEHMVENEYGKIVCIGSVTGALGGGGRKGGYAMAKGGIHALVKDLAFAGADHRVYCNGIAPGLVKTPLTAEDREFPPDYSPLGRVGRPADVAECILFLASQQSNWITGAVMRLDGGRYRLWRP